jgi:multicomponent Na+:H+ antiporter subunit E
MTAPRRARLGTVGIGVSLVVVWVLFWGELSAGNVLSGAALAAALLAVFPLEAVPHVDHRIRPLAILRLTVHFAIDLVVSTVLVARDVLVPSRTRTGIVACPLRVDAPGLATFLANLLALSPGTMPIEVAQGPPVIYVHVLRVDSPDAVRRRVARLEELAVAALGSPAALAAVRRDVRAEVVDP